MAMKLPSLFVPPIPLAMWLGCNLALSQLFGWVTMHTTQTDSRVWRTQHLSFHSFNIQFSLPALPARFGKLNIHIMTRLIIRQGARL